MSLEPLCLCKSSQEQQLPGLNLWGTRRFSPLFLSQDFIRLPCKSEGWVPAELTLKLGFVVVAALKWDFGVLKV